MHYPIIASPTSPKWLRKWLRKFANSFTYFTYIVSVTRMLAADTKMESGEGTNISKRLQLENTTNTILDKQDAAMNEKGNYVLANRKLR